MRSLIVGLFVFALTGLASATVSVFSPTNGSTVSTSVHVTSTSSSSHAITKTIVYIDNNQAYTNSSSTVSTYVTVAAGAHTMVVQSWDSVGTVLKSSAIAFTANASVVPANAAKYLNIDQMSGWESCDKCAGAGGNGPTAYHSLTQGVLSPVLNGKSTQLYLQPSTAYANALWWKQLGANSSVSNFSYDLYFYMKNPSASQALEFDLNQSINGKKYIFGTQCDIKNHHDWDIYDAYNHKWMQTGIACSVPQAYTWNHLILEFQRVNGQMKFISVTLNGKKSYFNKSYNPTTSSVTELNIAVQLDGDGSATPYNQWIDNVNMYAW
ncbi:hypothetical protein Acid345_0969 [Candidatus Koribacter versatilis Ellin345]|uniref:Uncharacterized protein n=1 Tax=Koribacter versatilis (strain Ellin345) TaxID=204669 RepID=Q1IT28_KORVE|nr:hypothetical protein [Candidatus Koribacter versatilis]ABF39972.1 hypothetical protein Acid345_0969 [Candidatus Koribacter versatilis Ellin345]